MTANLADTLGELPVNRLIHFTPAMNLHAIFQDRFIRTAQDLGTDSQRHFTVTDTARIDGQINRVCCSFEYPNAYYQDQARKKVEFINYPDWVYLALDPALILLEGTLFYPCNAATAGGAYGQVGSEGLRRMWANPSVPAGRRRGASHYASVPTDLQAEVQIPGPVPISAVQAVITSTAARCRELFGSLQAHGLQPQQVEWRYASVLFSKNALRAAIHGGSVIAEDVWLPTSEDLA